MSPLDEKLLAQLRQAVSKPEPPQADERREPVIQPTVDEDVEEEEPSPLVDEEEIEDINSKVRFTERPKHPCVNCGGTFVLHLGHDSVVCEGCRVPPTVYKHLHQIAVGLPGLNDITMELRTRHEGFLLEHPVADYFGDIFRLVKVLVEEARVKVDADALTIREMEPSHVAMVTLRLERSAFERYEASNPVEFIMEIGEFLKTFKNIRRGKATPAIELEYSAEVREKVTFDGRVTPVATDQRLTARFRYREGSVKEFEFHPLIEDRAEPPIPALQFHARVRVNVEWLDEVLRDAELRSDYVTLTAYPHGEAFEVSAKGELGKFRSKMRRGDMPVYEISYSGDNESRTHISLAYIHKIIKEVKATGISEEVTLEWTHKHPLRITVPIPSGEVTFLIAPRID